MDAQALAGPLGDFAAALSVQVADILQALSGAAPVADVPQTGAATPALKAELLGQLAQMLANDDAKAERLINDNTALLMACLPEQFRELRQAVREYDFEAALALLPSAHKI